MQEIYTIISHVFSLDMLIYAAILIVTIYAMIRCLIPIAGVSGKLRKASRTIITENKQRKEQKSWRDLHFLGDRLEAVWADFLQNAELREAHGETCDITDYINEDSVIYGIGNTALADLTPGILTSLGILGTFLGLVQGLSGLQLDAADTSVLLSAMQKLISGMSTAFVTSIAGVSASLLFNLLNNRQMTKCRAAMNRFCEVFSLYAMPKPVSQDTAMLTMQQEQTAYLKKAAEDIGEKMATQMEAAIMRAMLPVQRSMDNFIISATQAQVDGVDRIVQLFLRRMNTALGGEMDHFRQSLAENGAAQRQSAEQIQAAMKAIDEMSKDVINMQQMSQGLLEHFKAYVTDMSAGRAAADEQQKRMTEVLGNVESQYARQAELLNRMTAFQGSLEEYSRKYEKTTRDFLTSAETAAAGTCREMNRACAELRDGAKAFSDAGTEFASDGKKALDQASRRLEAAVSLLRETEGELRDTLKQAGKENPGD